MMSPPMQKAMKKRMSPRSLHPRSQYPRRLLHPRSHPRTSLGLHPRSQYPSPHPLPVRVSQVPPEGVQQPLPLPRLPLPLPPAVEPSPSWLFLLSVISKYKISREWYGTTASVPCKAIQGGYLTGPVVVVGSVVAFCSCCFDLVVLFVLGIIPTLLGIIPSSWVYYPHSLV